MRSVAGLAFARRWCYALPCGTRLLARAFRASSAVPLFPGCTALWDGLPALGSFAPSLRVDPCGHAGAPQREGPRPTSSVSVILPDEATGSGSDSGVNRPGTETMLALLPLAIGAGEGAALRAPMAIAVIGGLVTSTALSLVVIPCVYHLLARFDRLRVTPA